MSCGIALAVLRRKRQLFFVEIQPVLYVPILHGMFHKCLPGEFLIASSQPLQDSKVFLDSG